MSEYPNRQQQQGKFVLSQQNQSLLNHTHNHIHQQSGRPLLSKQNLPIRRPLACNANFWPNGSNINANANSNINNNVHTTTPTGALSTGVHGLFGAPGINGGGGSPGRDSLLNDENLKSNVQIVLDNINRNYHALREQILSNSNHNNLNNNCNNNNGNVNPHHLVLLQRLQSVSQQLKRTAGLSGQQPQQYQGKMAATSPDSDTNCNPYMPPLSCSIASSQDFSHDYSDYQWFMDYGYRDGITHQSILSALSASYNGIGELSYYEDLAKNIDANLAEVDMESFRTEDIHSLLTTLPTMCSESAELRRNRNNNRGDLILDTWAEATGNHGAGITTVADLENSICKSKLLFSPVKESHISVDSLDMDGYPDEDDIILTCQANKNNYTIAFEQSALYSDESFYDGPENYAKYKHFNVLHNLDHIIRKKAQETAMSVSEVGYTTWSKLRKNGPGQRLPMVATNPLLNHISRHAPTCFVRKSMSMPDLKGKCDGTETDHHSDEVDHSAEASEHSHKDQQHRHQLNVSQAASSGATSGESFGKQMRTLLPMYPVPTDSGSESSVPLKEDCNLDNNDEQQQHQPSFNLVKLFIKQKSSSTDTCMDVSSGCWPSDSTNSASGGENNNNSNTNLAVASSKDRCRKKSMNDSGKCSNLGRHDEEEFQFDSLDAQINNNNNNNGTTPIANGDDRQDRTRLNDFNSPVHKRNYKAYNLNIANKNLPADTNSDASRTSENLTQIFNNSGNNNGDAAGAKRKVPIEMITKSMQTSFIGTKEKVRVVPPSFLEHLNKLGDKQKAPVFVVYPNYVLPDLGFLKSQNDVVISPLSFKENFAPRTHLRKTRPVSMNDIENLKAKEYKHVLDWKSLITLLPQEYRKLLRNIPEANACSIAEDNAPQKPLFCMTPPLRRGRGVTCDCVNMFNTQTYNSSSSGGSSSQPPSSGYRGSSTMLTDSEMDLLGPSGSGGLSNNLYVYQYDSPAEVTSAERPPSGRVAPKGILRKTSVQRPSSKAKRNSMFEENHKSGQHLEKRRSLQEPCYNFSEENLILEDSINELPDSGLRKMNNSPNMSQHQARLPNTPKLPSADDYHRLNKLNEMNDLELNKAVSSKLNRAQQQQSLEDDSEARTRTEHFLSNVPKSELKHYAELAHFLEATTAENAIAQSEEVYDRQRLRHEVSRALSQRKNVSFNQPPTAGPINTTPVRQQQAQLLRPTEIKFSTPPNSPNMSVTMAQKPPQKPTPSAVQSPSSATEREKQDKIQSNRFKRLQIQWELLSKEGQQLKQELQQPRSGGNTPTGGAMKSRIPRPVSYPTTRANSDPMVSKTLKSPSRIVPPKRYNAGSLGTVAAIGGHQQQATTPPTPAPRTPNKLLHTTPKKAATAGTPRPATRTRIPVGSGQTQGKSLPSSNAAVKVMPKKPLNHAAPAASSSPKATIRKPVSSSSGRVAEKPNKGVVKV
ncbi:AAEL002498-PA [Aedes aegypti]|uniref:AAEL002498-PA n=1 Tax=Aedes aegypti TaxID=7159 RepID=Q17HZ5_AEDAE|nr:AAEL002498-PA [Aedes aegypti]